MCSRPAQHLDVTRKVGVLRLKSDVQSLETQGLANRSRAGPH